MKDIDKGIIKLLLEANIKPSKLIEMPLNKAHEAYKTYFYLTKYYPEFLINHKYPDKVDLLFVYETDKKIDYEFYSKDHWDNMIESYRFGLPTLEVFYKEKQDNKCVTCNGTGYLYKANYHKLTQCYIPDFNDKRLCNSCLGAGDDDKDLE